MSKVYVNGKDEPVEGRFEFSVSVDESKKPPVSSIEGRFVSDAGYSGKTHLRAKRSVEITMPLWYNDIHGTLSPVDAALLRLPHQERNDDLMGIIRDLINLPIDLIRLYPNYCHPPVDAEVPTNRPPTFLSDRPRSKTLELLRVICDLLAKSEHPPLSNKNQSDRTS